MIWAILGGFVLGVIVTLILWLAVEVRDAPLIDDSGEWPG